ncbi:unnamed protein product, partial [Trichogramma brassicae]
ITRITEDAASALHGARVERLERAVARRYKRRVRRGGALIIIFHKTKKKRTEEIRRKTPSVKQLSHIRSPFARREPYYTRAPEFTSPNRILPRPTYPRREEYHRDFRRDNTRNYQSNRPANVHEIDIHETEEEFPRDDVSAESNQQGSGNE